MYRGKLSFVALVILMLVSIACTSCNTTSEILNTSNESERNEPVDTSEPIVNFTSDVTSGFEPDGVETSIEFPWGGLYWI